MSAMSNVARLFIAPPSPQGDYPGGARRSAEFAQTLDADWTEIGVDKRRIQHAAQRQHGQRRTRDEQFAPAGEPSAEFATQMIAQGMGRGAHLENFRGVSAAYQRAESSPYAPQRGAGLSLVI
jgi:hypothetical protein